MHQSQERKLPLGRQSGFRFIEKIQAGANSILQHREKCLAVRLLVERLSAVTLVWVTSGFTVPKISVALARIEKGSKVSVKLVSQKIAVAGLLAKCWPQHL